MGKYNLDTKSRYTTHNVILSLIGENLNILDVGCNRGYIGETASKSNTFYGLEFDSNNVTQAKESYRDVLKYDLNILDALPWDISFDTIIFADVLEHILFPDNVLLFLKQYLKKDGHIIVSIPNIANWMIRIQLLFGNFNYTETGIMDKTHLHFYTFKTAQNLLEKNGFYVESIYSGATYFGPIIRVFPFLKSLFATNIIYYAKQ